MSSVILKKIFSVQKQQISYSIYKSYFINQIRLTHIVKRKTKPQIGKSWINDLIVGPYIKEEIKYKDYRNPADFIYDYVEDTDKRPAQPIKVLLLKHVDELGIPGDIVEVTQDRARFELILPKLATYVSPYNLEKYKDLIEKRHKEATGPSSRFSRVTAKKLEKQVIQVLVSEQTEWTIQKWHIRVALRRAGYYVPEHAIELPKTPITGPDIQGKQGKDFAVIITINNHEKIPVRCCIHHNNQPLKNNWFRAPRSILLPDEQGQLLESMFVHEAIEEQVEEEQFEA